MQCGIYAREINGTIRYTSVSVPHATNIGTIVDDDARVLTCLGCIGDRRP
jgi:hypothetical protein